MKAAQLVAPRKWQMIDLEKPRASVGNMLVRLERVALCGTDKPFFCGLSPSYPMEPGASGHEGLGVVESCPSGKFQEGDRVILWGFDRGLFQEYVLAPDVLAPEHGCIMLPGDFDLEVGLMSQLLGTVIHSFFKLGNVINQQVVVLGQGSVGQLFNATLRNLGAKYIIGVDPLVHKLEVAPKMGATHTINPGERDVEEAVREITGGEMADIVVEAIGHEETLNMCAPLLRRNGTLIYFGVPDKDNHEGVLRVNFREIFTRELRVITTVGPNPQRDYTTAMDWITQGRLDVRPIISHVLPFEQIQQAFEMAFDRPAEHRALKVVLKF